MQAKIFCLLFVLAVTPTLLGNENAEARKAGAVASDFINSYLEASQKFLSYQDSINWVNKNPLTTSAYKASLEKLYLDALREDPEMGYGADAIMSSQDNPEAMRVQTVKVMGESAEVDLIGIHNNPLRLKVGLVKEQGKWLVDSSGDVNP
jgi:hypothetical protein